MVSGVCIPTRERGNEFKIDCKDDGQKMATYVAPELDIANHFTDVGNMVEMGGVRRECEKI